MYRFLRKDFSRMPQIATFAMLTDPGRVRRGNEDACAADLALGAFVVCDGIGGAAAGEVASHMAAETFLDHIAHGHLPASPADLEDAVLAANDAVYRHSLQSLDLNGMGTTLVALVFESLPGSESTEPPHANIVHIGDSRCYRWRAGELHRLTEDHSLVEEQFRAGHLTRAEADQAPWRNIITRAVGSSEHVEPVIETHRTQPGDLYLLASDGLTRELTDEEIAAILQACAPRHSEARDASDLSATCRTFIDAANEAGGHDNITVLLVKIARPPPAVG
jgi:protein phosphatase